MPHGSGAPSPSPPRPSSKPNRDRKEQGRVSKNHRPTQRVNIRAAVQRWSEAPEDASMSRTASGSLGAGEEFFPPPTSTPDTPASPSPPPHTAPPSWTAPARTASAPEPMDVAPPRPTTAARDMGVTHPTAATSATPRPTPRSPLRTALAQPADATAKAARAHATTSTSASKTSHKPPSGSKTSTAPPRSKRPHQPATAPTQPAPPSAAPPRAAPVLPAPPDNSMPGRFPSPTKEPAGKRQAIYTSPPFRPPPLLPPFAPPQQVAAPKATYAAAASPTATGTRAPTPATAGATAPKTPAAGNIGAPAPTPTTAAAPAPTSAPAPAPSSAPAPRARYPPLIVEKLPNWVEHFAALRQRLGHAPNARPFGKGMRFTPRSDVEYRSIQTYLTDLERTQGIAWFSYSLPAERSLKVAIRGLPAETPVDAIQEALRDCGYNAEYVRPIRARQGRPGCLFYAQVARTEDTIPGIYGVTELLCMPGIKIEAWRGKKGPAQCHRCQQFRHSSHNCHRPIACVRCGEAHPASECPRPKEEPPTCANCGGAHTANNSSCPVFRRETRNPKAGTVARTTATTTSKPAAAQPKGESDAPGSLMAAANEPGSKRRTRRRRRKAKQAPPAATTAAAAAPAPATTAAPVVARSVTHTTAAKAPASAKAPAAAKAPVAAATKAKRQAPPRPPPQVLTINDVVRILQGIVTALVTQRSDPVPLLLDAIKSLVCDGPAAP
ncbi:unnamed protein product [Spodoptera exigua]|nr:unnamed protein product [Spodoptera exigua]